VQGSWIAQLQGGLHPSPIATPYGLADMDTVGVYSGNQQLRHRPIERNRARVDFHSGLALQLQNGGVRLPSDALPRSITPSCATPSCLTVPVNP
jgi:hypothetical protein